MAQKVRIRDAHTRHREGKPEGMLANPIKEGTYRFEVSRRIRVDNDGVVEFSHHLLQALGSLLAHLDEAAAQSTTALKHDELFPMGPRESTKRRERRSVIEGSIMMERKTQVKKKTNPSFFQGAEGLIYVGQKQLAEAADLVEALQVDVDVKNSRILRSYHHRTRMQGGRVLDQVGREVLV